MIEFDDEEFLSWQDCPEVPVTSLAWLYMTHAYKWKTAALLPSRLWLDENICTTRCFLFSWYKRMHTQGD